ncbi:MAG TPA: glycosyltransferase family A protein, partial [Candidatus Hydrogenedentes bacterium]|nr:glycosyltransferase family A protein [Candidatus Hydrogenedentota bacterium]
MAIQFSVVIPAHNEEAVIALCLRSLEAMDYPRERYEVIVVDDASTDRTAEIAREFGARVITEKCASIAAVRNRGAREARGEIIAHLDADMIVDPLWLKRAEEHYEAGLTGALYFQDDVPEDASWIGRMWYGPFRADNSEVRHVDFLPTRNLFVPKAL